jgi:hypothetical protein
MARTETVQIVRDNWAVSVGLDPTNITTDDATAFLSLLNKSIREAWQRAEFPFVTKTTAHITDAYDMVDLSSNTTISEVLRAYDSHPYRSANAKQLRAPIPVEDSEIEGVFVRDAADIVILTATLASTGTTATATTTVAHNLVIGSSVVIAGAVETDYNGTFVIVTVPSTTTFTYTMLADPADTATGTITATGCVAYLFSRIRETVYTSLSETVPFKLSSYLSTRIAGLWLKSEGQEEKGMARLAEAEDLILREIERVEMQQQHQPPTNNNTRVTGIR